MSKKVISILLSAVMIVAVLCMGAVPASAYSTKYHAGDSVSVIVLLGGIDGASAISTNIYYNADVLEYDSATESQMIFANKFEDGTIKVGAIFSPIGVSDYAGAPKQFISLSFKVVKDTDDLGISHETTSLSQVVNGQNTRVVGKGIDATDVWSSIQISVECVHDVSADDSDVGSNITDSDSNAASTDNSNDTAASDNSASTDAEASDTAVTVDSDSTASVATDSDNTVDVPDVLASDTSSESTASDKVDSSKASDSDAKSTKDQADSNKDSSKNSSSSSGSNSTSSSGSSSNGSAVQTAGTFAVISLIVVLMAAAAIVTKTRKKTN